MRIELTEPRATRDLVRFLRDRDYLAVEEPGGVVEVVPIQVVSELADRARTLRDLGAWLAQHPGVGATPETYVGGLDETQPMPPTHAARFRMRRPQSTP